MCQIPPVLVMPVQFPLPLRWGPSWPNISVMPSDVPQPPNHCSFRCSRRCPPLPVAAAAAAAAAAAVAFVLLVVIAALLLLFATNRFCFLLLVSSRCVVCVYSLVACLDHSWVSRSLESDMINVRRVLAECFSCIWSSFVSRLLKLRYIWRRMLILRL